MTEETRGPGRPEFQPTNDMREQVEWYTATGMTQEDIAKVIGITVPTLTKHFSDNLDNGYARRQAAVIDMIVAAAKKGNASVQRRLQQIIAEQGAFHAFQKTQRGGAEDEDDDKVATPAQRIGKKQAAKNAAQTAGQGTGWGDDLIVVNPN